MILNGGFMKKYIEIIIGGKRYRFLVDEELDSVLKSSLKERYRFDASNTLVVENNDLINSYNLKQLILKSILNQIDTYDLTPDLRKKIDSLKNYVGSKSTVYSSDLSKLDSILGEASEIYGGVRNTLSKKEKAQEQREQVKESLEEIQDIIQKTDYENDNLSETTSSTEDKLEEFKALIEEVSHEEELKDKIPVNEINDAMDRVIICSSMEEFINKTGNNVGSYDVVNAIKNKNEKIVLPPNSKLEDVAVEILKTCINDKTLMDKVVTYVERKAVYKNKADAAFESLRSSLKVSGLNSRNLNYFGDQFFSAFESICSESGMSFESMFADYFNSYSANRKYNSPMDKFIRLFNKYNGGNDDTRALLEAMLVKKAISRGLISRKYNNYLKDEYRNLNVSSGGYINFNESSFSNITGGISSSEAHSVNIASEGHLGTNNNSYEGDLQYDTTISKAGIGETIDNPTLNNNKGSSYTTAQANLNASMNVKRNGIRGEIADKKEFGITTTQTQARSSGISISGRRFTSNSMLNPALLSEDGAEEEEYNEDFVETGFDESNVDIENSNNYGDSDFQENNVNNNSLSSNVQNAAQEAGNNLADNATEAAKDAAKNAVKDAVKKNVKKAIIEFIKKNPWTWVVIGVILLLLLILFIILASSDDNKNQGLGYYDSACNFNATKVVVSSCETTSNLQNLDLKDYVTRMAYLYTKDGDYSDETIKALMIVLKTNVLSLGGYVSGSKNVNVKICDVYDGVINESSLFDGVEGSLEKLNSIYEQISEYLFISSSYKSSISSLGSANSIAINSSILENLESEAVSGSNYSEILNNVFKVETEENITINEARENIFLGDSRTQGMLLTSVINESNTVYGVGYGYNWLVGNSGFTGTTNASNGGINAVNSKIANGKLYNIIIWLGVNDLGNVNSYLEKYIDLAKGEWSNHNLYIVSVGPVLDSSSKYAKNETINEFNNAMKDGINKASLNNLKYVDLGYTESSIKSYDSAGVHYSSEDYRNIYTKMTSNIVSGPSSISTKLALYRLSDYCTYYTLTENDAYWWPIGSKEPTQGNIYGGTPTATTITSPFGPRIINNIKSNHKGIDISGGTACFSNVIIASKSGTVTTMNDSCPTNGSYGSSCGGGYGNYVIIDHGDGTSTVYAHMSSGTVSVKVGDTVSQGQKIGVMGSSGSSTGCHLHFEVRLEGTKVNPSNYVKADNPRPVNSINANISGNDGDGKNMVCSSLLASGFSKEATIGIMANLYAESGYNPINLQNSYESKLGYTDSSYTLAVDNGSYKNFSSDSAGYGLVQWTSGGRKLNLYNYAKERNVSIGNFEMQFNFMLRELERSYSNTYKYITGGHNAIDTGAYWCDHYESPGGSEPCSIHGNCPSQHCINRTKNSILSDKIEEYVNNGCKY